MFVAIGGRRRTMGVADPIKVSTAEAIKRAEGDGVQDRHVDRRQPNTAAAVAQKLGLDQVEAEVLPDQKLRW